MLCAFYECLFMKKNIVRKSKIAKRISNKKKLESHKWPKNNVKE